MTLVAMEIHPPIFIIGYMACGKTTLGRALARRLGREFIDLDFYIEQRFRRSISQIFATDGEEAFRSAEHAMLAEVGEMQDVVIACGGGTPCFHGNMDFMLSRGTVIYLDTSVDRIVERLTRNRSRRPLMADKSPSQLHDEVAAGIARRLPYYTRAHVTHPGEQLEDRRQIAATVEALLPLL